MKIFTDKFWEWTRIFLLLFFLFTTLTKAYISINLETPFLFIAPFILLLYSFTHFHNHKPFYIDGIIAYLIYVPIMSVFWYEFKEDFMQEVYFTLDPYGILALYILLSNIKKKLTFFVCIHAILIFGAFQAIIGFLQVNFGFPNFKVSENIVDELELSTSARNYFALLGLGGKDTAMASGTFNHFNNLGQVMVTCTTMAFGIWYFFKHSKVHLALFLLCYLGVIVTFSRGALIASSLGIFYIYITQTRFPFIKIFVFAFFGFFFYSILSENLKEYAEETGHAGVRYDTWIYALKFALKEPIHLFFGYGYHILSSRVLIVNKMISNIQYDPIMGSPHSSHVQMFIETGVVGLLLYVIGLGQIIATAVKRKDIWASATVGLIIAFLFSETLEAGFFDFAGSLFISFLGLANSYFKMNKLNYYTIDGTT